MGMKVVEKKREVQREIQRLGRILKQGKYRLSLKDQRDSKDRKESSHGRLVKK